MNDLIKPPQSDISNDKPELQRSLQAAFTVLLHCALGINDQLRIGPDHVEYEGGMNQAEQFRELVNSLHYNWCDYV